MRSSGFKEWMREGMDERMGKFGDCVIVFRCSGVQVFRCSGVQVFRCSGVQVKSDSKLETPNPKLPLRTLETKKPSNPSNFLSILSFPNPLYLSASPITGSMDPMMTTASASILPSTILESSCRLLKEGELIFRRQGEPVPSDLM
jgi:hypothetical protein